MLVLPEIKPIVDYWVIDCEQRFTKGLVEFVVRKVLVSGKSFLGELNSSMFWMRKCDVRYGSLKIENVS